MFSPKCVGFRCWVFSPVILCFFFMIWLTRSRLESLTSRAEAPPEPPRTSLGSVPYVLPTLLFSCRISVISYFSIEGCTLFSTTSAKSMCSTLAAVQSRAQEMRSPSCCSACKPSLQLGSKTDFVNFPGGWQGLISKIVLRVQKLAQDQLDKESQGQRRFPPRSPCQLLNHRSFDQ